MTTIYFDQFAISGMSEPTNNLWYQIRNILFDLKVRIKYAVVLLQKQFSKHRKGIVWV